MIGNTYLDFEGFWDLQVELHGLKQQEGVQPLAREHQWQLLQHVWESGAEKEEMNKVLSGNLSWFRNGSLQFSAPAESQTTLCSLLCEGLERRIGGTKGRGLRQERFTRNSNEINSNSHNINN